MCFSSIFWFDYFLFSEFQLYRLCVQSRHVVAIRLHPYGSCSSYLLVGVFYVPVVTTTPSQHAYGFFITGSQLTNTAWIGRISIFVQKFLFFIIQDFIQRKFELICIFSILTSFVSCANSIHRRFVV